MSIASEITRLQGAKADIKSAIEAKGVTVPSSAKLDTYDDYIAQITVGGEAIPSSLSVSGSWTNQQIIGNAPDLTGLTFTVAYQSRSVTPDTVSPATYTSTGSQTVTFSFTENGTTVSTTKTATVVRIPSSISVSGSWTNTQYTNTAMDTTGLTFTVTYNNGSTQTVTPVKSPSTWGSSAGTQTATFSYTEAGTTVTTTKTATVVAITLSSLSVSGSWTNTQYTGQAPDITGLSFTATYNNGNTVSVSPSNISVSPSVWGSTAGTQTATFSYTSGGVTKTTTKTASVEERVVLKYVGGIIFYIDSTADGTYTFYNSNGTQVSAPTVGTDCTGWTYSVSGASKDKYYVVYDNLYTTNRWCPYINGAYVRVSTGYNAKSIGSGKTNTAGIMAIDNGKYIQASSNGSPTVWYTISQMRSSKPGGCDDWFVGSEEELEQLRLSGAGNSATWFSGNHIWSSSEYSSNNAWCWRYSSSVWNNIAKSSSIECCICGVRAF